MRGLRMSLLVALALAATPAVARRAAPAGFAEPADIIAAESHFTQLSAAKGIKAAIRATAAPDAQIFAPQLMRMAEYADSADARLATGRHTVQLWMSCDGSIAVTHGEWQRPPALGWYVTIWRRQKGGGYKWLLAERGALDAPPPQSDMIIAKVADCPARRPRADGAKTAPFPDRRTAPMVDHLSGHSDDATLEWATTISPDGSPSFVLRLKQDAAMREVLRAPAQPGR